MRSGERGSSGDAPLSSGGSEQFEGYYALVHFIVEQNTFHLLDIQMQIQMAF